MAYRNGMLFNPATWREIFKPQVKRLIDICHKNGLMVVCHVRAMESDDPDVLKREVLYKLE